MFQDEKPWLTIREACDYVRCVRSTLYEWMNALHIEPRKFPRDKRLYLSLADVKRIKQVRAQPWLAENGLQRSEQQGDSDQAEAEQQ